MINQNELRIGGQFIDPKDGVTYKATSITLFTVTGASKKGEQYAFSYDQIDPIPLTEEILDKVGFLKMKRGYLQLHLGYNTHIVVFRDNIGGLFYEDSEETLYEMYNELSIRYVHQLQNLYFSITNQELDIKL